MARSIRFHLDEDCSAALAADLRRRGIDATRTPDVGLLHVKDEKQLAFAVANNRVLFTFDKHFSAIHAKGVQHRGIIHCHREKYPLGEIIRGLTRIWEDAEPEDLKNRFVWL